MTACEEKTKKIGPAFDAPRTLTAIQKNITRSPAEERLRAFRYCQAVSPEAWSPMDFTKRSPSLFMRRSSNKAPQRACTAQHSLHLGAARSAQDLAPSSTAGAIVTSYRDALRKEKQNRQLPRFRALPYYGLRDDVLRTLAALTRCQITSGSDHVAMLTAKGELLTMGCGEQGQLGRLSTRTETRWSCVRAENPLKPTIVPVTKPKGCKTRAFDRVWAGAYATFARLRDSGKLWACGLNNYHQLGELPQLSCKIAAIIPWPQPLISCEKHRWKLVSGGQHHTLLLSEVGSVFSLGRKEYGHLRLGTTTLANNDDKATPFQVPGLSGCVDILCGEAVSLLCH
ncbi:hypothetical protein HPB50_028147 [Hyalomma asiaticum]|nr:hypothetical protein HPB50_028147 [Hyalomma asiaticum]